MSTARLQMYILPKKHWEKQDDPVADISCFVADALAIERRLKKGVNMTNERMRYRLCCRRIQAAVSRFRDSGEKETLGESYLAILRFLYTDVRTSADAAKSRIATNFFPPEKIREQIGEFSNITSLAGLSENNDVKRRLAFLNTALTKGDGIIEVQEFYVNDTQAAGDAGDIVSLARLTTPLYPSHDAASQKTGFGMEDCLSPNERREILSVFKAQIEKAMQTGGTVNFSNQPHFIIADALNEYVYKVHTGQETKMIRVIYMDGSEAEPFPLRCLTKLEHKEPESGPLKVSLVSMRHLEMDSKVDLAWYRNRDVSVPRPFAETDALCTEKTYEQLQEVAGRRFSIHLYQTGLETAVVGFYRGLVRFIREQNERQLTVVPYYFDKKEGIYNRGRLWG
ncbi:MAG: hypothetical protein E3K32_03335 [wastewater metagenome]|nr:hypothetical protein [Candidatus Loosdrechtia aerotolerans]